MWVSVKGVITIMIDIDSAKTTLFSGINNIPPDGEWWRKSSIECSGILV